ncbi:hypothetical protein B0T20DRAFT_190300 [Sordaria brevicollis]|uniref:Uncharacterized protein n=1 Tax=Sordaria brevicollis TaxID=83679 RepID=A0AAE0UCI1_SORBR|nr:hypothetical protein B0T20DRAFT_190300 [Sordaria brevicollis]
MDITADITMDIRVDIDINPNPPPRDIAVTSHLYEHHDLLPNRIPKAIIRASPHTRVQTWSNKAAENWSKLRESAQKSASRHPAPLTTEQLDIAKTKKGDLFVVVGELLYSPDSDSDSDIDEAPRPPKNTKTTINDNSNRLSSENIWASHLVCIRACNVRGNLYALVSDVNDKRLWNFLALPQNVNDWVAYYPEFTGYPDEEQAKQHKTRRTVWKRKMVAFCSGSLGIKRTYNHFFDSKNTDKMAKALPTVIKKKSPAGKSPPAATTAPSQAEAVQQNQGTPCANYVRSFEVTNRLLYPTDPSVGLDEKEIDEIIKACTTLWRLQEGHLTEECVREISQGVQRGLLVGKPALPPFQHHAFVLNCLVMSRSAGRRYSVVKWDDIIEDAFDMAWNTTNPHPVDGRGNKVWNFGSEVIALDDD